MVVAEFRIGTSGECNCQLTVAHNDMYHAHTYIRIGGVATATTASGPVSSRNIPESECSQLVSTTNAGIGGESEVEIKK